jgi:hypothetical protein
MILPGILVTRPRRVLTGMKEAGIGSAEKSIHHGRKILSAGLKKLVSIWFRKKARVGGEGQYQRG